MDFGIAKVFAGKQLTVTGGLVGTAEFLSPEQAAGKPVTHRSDLYSFGVVLYTLLTGRPPFEGRSTLDLMHKHRFAQFDSPQRLVPEIPYDLDKTVCELMEKEPAKRPANAQVLLRQLETLQNKINRREQHTVVTAKDGMAAAAKDEQSSMRSNPGPATLMSQLIRQEVAAQQRTNPLVRFLNKPVVLVTLFVLCLGIVVWGIWFRPGESSPSTNEGPRAETQAEQLFKKAQRLYNTGHKLAAREFWQDLAIGFLEVPSATKWVNLAMERLAETKGDPQDEHEWGPVNEALQKARIFRDNGNREGAERIWDAFENMYRHDDTAYHIVKQIQRDRRK